MTTTSAIPYTRANSLKDNIWYAATRDVFLLRRTHGQFAMVLIKGRQGIERPPHIHYREDECFYVLDFD